MSHTGKLTDEQLTKLHHLRKMQDAREEAAKQLRQLDDQIAAFSAQIEDEMGANLRAFYAREYLTTIYGEISDEKWARAMKRLAHEEGQCSPPCHVCGDKLVFHVVMPHQPEEADEQQ